MTPAARLLLAPVIRWASRLRFPRLLALTGALFVADLLIPDMIPFLDEILLALLTALLATMRRRGVPDAETPGRRSAG